jgi:hypothetical protein
MDRTSSSGLCFKEIGWDSLRLARMSDRNSCYGLGSGRGHKDIPRPTTRSSDPHQISVTLELKISFIDIQGIIN